ncbi:AEC family transporter [Marinobacterium weihaiense]|uniref:AEC family transporter n=1 Tax=Marinobacterium weihaiense TaxID=2851016 RepID=A0ABS6M8F1_9GAMM|nr:AEC family transporter [Marinobacterium weihaiense]MBV0932564.1 AEC family transporter [Marinobacterium weihaiense]
MNLYLQTLGYTADIVAPIFFILFLGYLLRRLKLIDDAFVATGSKLVFVITLPTLVFMSISRMDFHAVFNPHQLGYVLVAILLSFGLIWWLAARFIQAPEDLGVFIQGAFRSNYGIIGLAVSFNLFGEAGLAQASLLLALVIPLFNSLSIICLSVPMRRSDMKLSRTLVEILKNPLILAVLFALPVSWFGVKLPDVVAKTGTYFANLTLPLALLTIGASLNLKSLHDTSAQAFWATALKLVILPLVLTFGAWLYGFDGEALAILMVLFGCPTAAASFVMARAMGGNHQLAANIVLTTTLGSVLTLSAGIYLLRLIGMI